MMPMERRTYKAPLTLTRDDTPDQGVGMLTGYCAVFNSDSVDMGGYVEQIRQGAFAESLTRNDVVALVNHNQSVVVGRMSAGTLKLYEDHSGLAFSIDLPDTQAGRDLRTSVERGDLIGCSFGFNIEPNDMTWSQRDGMDMCTLNRIDLHEISVGVTFPAYPETSMDVRAIRKARVDMMRARAWAKKEIERKCHR